MALRDEIVPFIDGNNLVAPNLVPKGTIQGSDNGPMFTAEFYDILAKSGQLTDQDRADFAQRIGACIHSHLLNRAPVDTAIEGPDDYYGVLSASKILGNTDIPRSFLWAIVIYQGFLNNSNPGKWTLESFLIRQVQMLAAMVSAAFPSMWNPLHWVIRILAFPAYFYAACVIATSCWNVPTNDTDSRRLSWHLIQTTKSTSLLCYLASLIWYKRLHKDYGDNGMQAVAKVYYQDSHPFQRYWVD